MNKKDLHKIAPKLSELSLKKSGFEIPDKYFDTIEDAVFAELKADKFQKKSQKETFKTPDDYFDNVEDIVIAKLKAEAIQNKNIYNTETPKDYFNSVDETIFSKIKTETKVVSLKNRLTKIIAPLAIAASLLLIFTLNNQEKSITFESLATSDIENWIYNGNVEIDALSIASIYPNIEISDIIYTSTVTEEEYIDYLNSEDLELIMYEN
jgi:hypothetical protein